MKCEDELIKKAVRGDKEATDKLVEMFYAEILRYCLWHTPDRQIAEDAVQETFLKAIRYFDRYSHQGKFKAFLYQIAANTCIDMQRKHRRCDVSWEEAAIEPAYAEQGYEEVRSDMALRQLVGTLSEDSQEIVLLRFGQDLTMREIAKVVNMPLRTVQSRLRSALKKLKKEFEGNNRPGGAAPGQKQEGHENRNF